jgi:peroxiredoxin
MKRLLLLLFFIPLFAFAQSEGFVVKGTLTDIVEGTEVKLLNSQDKATIAQGTVKGGSFVLKGKLQEPNLVWLTIGNTQPQYIYLENGTVKVSGSTKNIKVEGSKSHVDFDNFRKKFDPLGAQLGTAAEQIQKAQTLQDREALISKYDSLNRVLSGEVSAFVASRPSSYVSPFVLYVTTQFNRDINIVEKDYLQLDSTIRYSIIGKALAQFITYNKVGTIGTDAIDFAQADTSGKTVSLSSFRGKYVLIDFWASWCGPCRRENPNVVKAFEKFKDKNFTILGVSLDQNKEAWLKAIEKDNLTWTHVSDLQSWSNAVAQLYRVQSIPQNFLIDPNGKIVAKNLTGETLTEELCKLLGCN